MNRSPLALHLPDADHLTGAEIAAALDLSPAAFLVLVYARWDEDKGVALSTSNLMRSLGHDRLYVRFHADPHPPGYAKTIGGPEAWGRLCARRMGQYYGSLGVQLHAILANETDADYEGGLSVAAASDFYRRAIGAYEAKRPDDIIHVPAPTGAPATHREHLQRFKADGWIKSRYWIDGHGYNGDLENVLNVLEEECPGHQYTITETNDIADFRWPVELLRQGRARDVVYFILNWARGGIGRVQPPSADDAAKQMSLLRFPARYQQFKATVAAAEPEAPVYRVPAWTPAYEHIRDGAIQVADEFGMPRRRLLGLCLAESGFGLQSFDRWASTERSKRMKAAIDAQDWRLVEVIFDEIAGTPTNDISFGPCHQTWYWSAEYPGDRAPNGPHRHNLQEIMEFRARYIEDHGRALRVAAGKIRDRSGMDDLEILARYNKPDGSASGSVRANYARSLDEADRILAEIEQPQEPTMTVYESFPDPEPAGVLNQCDGVIFHGSRSGRAGNPLDAEYLGTARYEQSNSLGLGWNATVGPGKVAIHMPADRWGHNARAASSRYVGIEIAQPTVNDPLPDSVAMAVADYIYDHVWPVWGEVWHFPSHAEIEDWGETGQQDGKTDLYPTGDDRMNVFRQKVYDRLNARKEGTPGPTPEPPTYDQLANLVGNAFSESGVVVPALAAAVANPDDTNLRMQTDAVLRWLRENRPPAA